MILVGQYDSPFVRRVAISLKLLGLTYEQDTRSVFGDFQSMLKTNPLGRVPTLQLDDGTKLIDSAAILDWLDENVGPERALIPHSGSARVEALQRIALAVGTIDKIGAANYERLIRPSKYRWPEWTERLLTQCLKVTDPELLAPGRYPSLDALAARLGAMAEFRETSFRDYAVPRGE
jgi:glutathione S-transferase